jgi:glutathione peroxidase
LICLNKLRLFLASILWASTLATHAACPELLNFSFTLLTGGDKRNFCEYQGKVLIVVNTASYCGNTPQYKGLQALYKKYADQGLLVLGFPSNDFGGQEPGAPTEIAEFCERTYQVSFPMFEKSSVRTTNGNPLYDKLAALSGERPRWNFHKYLIDRSGKIVISFSSATLPEDKEFVRTLEAQLAVK